MVLRLKTKVGPDNSVVIHLPPDVKAEQVTVTVELPDSNGALNVEPRDEWERAIWREQQAYMRMHATLVQSHLNKYVALVDGVVVDTDDSQAAIWERMEVTFANRPFFITKVQSEAFPTLRIHSPKIVRS